jgi:APA family basic amino acid/polyamine antiporter
MPERTTARPELARDLGVSHASAVVVGTIIGSGIFLVPAEMMQAVGSAKLVYLAWLVGGLLSFFGALTYAELGAMKPQAGGEYVYVRDAYGPLGGFLYAWTWFVIAKPASVAAVATGLVRILATFSTFSFFSENVLSRPFAVTWGQVAAISAAIFISALNYRGIKKAGKFQLIFTVLKVVIILGIVVVCFSGRGWGHFGGTFAGATGGMAGFMAALVAALWAYDGWNDLNMVAGEVRDPGRNIPIALIAGVATVGVLYVLMNAAVLYVLPAKEIAVSPRPVSLAVAAVLGHWGASVVAVGMAVSMLVTLNGTIMSGARVPFAVARDRYFFAALAEVHPRFHTPSFAIMVQAGLSIALLLLGGNFRQLFSLAIFAEWLFYMIAGSTVFVFRWRDRDAVRPYRVLGYPFVPALFIAAAAVLLYYTFRENWPNSLYGLLVILAGTSVFHGFAPQKTEKKWLALISAAAGALVEMGEYARSGDLTVHGPGVAIGLFALLLIVDLAQDAIKHFWKGIAEGITNKFEAPQSIRREVTHELTLQEKSEREEAILTSIESNFPYDSSGETPSYRLSPPIEFSDGGSQITIRSGLLTSCKIESSYPTGKLLTIRIRRVAPMRTAFDVVAAMVLVPLVLFYKLADHPDNSDLLSGVFVLAVLFFLVRIPISLLTRRAARRKFPELKLREAASRLEEVLDMRFRTIPGVGDVPSEAG